MDFEEAKSFYVLNKNIIDKIIKIFCSKNKLSFDLSEEFTSHVNVKLMEESCKKIRVFKGDSTFKTYITNVIRNIFEDEKRRLWGRWKPSRKAIEMGPEAEILEQLVFRDKNIWEQAYDILTTNHKITISRDRAFELLETLEEVHLKLERPDTVGFPPGEPPAGNAPTPDDMLIEEEELSKKNQIIDVIKRIRKSLSNEDRIILRMRFEDSMGISEIARGLNVKRSYVDKRLKRILKQFKEEIRKCGISEDEIVAIIEIIMD